jgi:hypothetical protein
MGLMPEEIRGAGCENRWAEREIKEYLYRKWIPWCHADHDRLKIR